jgi:hypothetical protein
MMTLKRFHVRAAFNESTKENVAFSTAHHLKAWPMDETPAAPRP